MSFRSDHVVVPFATFVERRERRNGIASTLQKRDRNDAAVKSPSALAVAISVAGGDGVGQEVRPPNEIGGLWRRLVLLRGRN